MVLCYSKARKATQRVRTEDLSKVHQEIAVSLKITSPIASVRWGGGGSFSAPAPVPIESRGRGVITSEQFSIIKAVSAIAL